MSSSSLEQTWNQILPGAWSMEDLLSEEECQQLLQMAHEDGILELTMQGDTRHRQRVTSRLQAPDISKLLWERVQGQIPQEIVINESNYAEKSAFLSDPGTSPQEFIGRWTPSGMTPRVNVAYCSGRGHLAAHRDADHVAGPHERSFLTINGYLTSRPAGTGGATRFLVEDIPVQGSDIVIREEHIRYRVEADKAGKAVVFFHGLMHDGEPLIGEDCPPKWIFRALVYYKRDPITAPVMTEKQKQARQTLKEAVAAEEVGEINQAIRLYRKAYRLDPSLDR